MASREFADYLVELLAPLGPVTAKRMFGGFGLYLDGLMFAIIVDDSLYLKADAENRATFAARDMAPFVYERQGKPVAMAYLPTAHAAVGTPVFAEVRGKRLPMTVTAMPFTPNRYYRG